MISQQQFPEDKDILNSNSDNNNLTWTPPPEQWNQSNNNDSNNNATSNSLSSSLLVDSGANSILTPPSDFLSETSLDDIASDEFWNVLHNGRNNNHLGNSSLIGGGGLSDGLNEDENDSGLGISVENK